MPVALVRSRYFAHAALLCAMVGATLPTASIAASKTLTISGTPAATVAVGGHYSFQPAAKDTVKSRIKFDIYNKPDWAQFDGTTGHLSGTPNRYQVGTYKNITIRLTDWYGFVTTVPFSITVVKASAPPPPPPPPRVTYGNVTLDWTPPTENTDGSVLSDLAGYNVSYGTSPSSLTQHVKVSNAGVASLVIDNLTPGTWYFSVTSYNTSGVESPSSAVVSTKVL